MKRIILSLMVALIATTAMAQTETWKKEYEAITKRAEEISKLYETQVKDNASKEDLKKTVDDFYVQMDSLLALAKRVAADGSDPELAKQLILEVGQMAEYEDLKELMPEDAPWYNDPELEGVRKWMGLLALRAPGIKYTDLTMNDLSGESHSLSEWCAKGNYVLVDFWASWCGPCVKEMPNVVTAYNRYHDKGFDVVGISFDNKKEAWADAVKNLNLPWHHISDLKGWESAASPVYGIRSIPSNILVSPDGIIVASDLREERLLKKLEEIYKF